VAMPRLDVPAVVIRRRSVCPGRGMAAKLGEESRRFHLCNQDIPAIKERGLPMNIASRIAFLGSLLLVCGLLHAQDGCVSSPECPTAVLGLVGAAGAALYVRFRSR
jgi:hypothetical protein